MTWIIDTKSQGRLTAKFAAGLALSALLVFGTFVVPASAAGHRGGGHAGGHAGGHGGGRGGGYRGGGGGGGYYVAPPVVYGSPYGDSYYGTPYYPPPVVYSPGIDISLPGISIGIQ